PGAGRTTVPLTLLSVVLPWLVVAFCCWISYQLMQQNGRIVLRLEGVEQQLAELRALNQAAIAPAAPRGFPQSLLPHPGDTRQGLPLGSLAPEFELPDLSGGRKSLAQYRGRRLLLIFFNPRCGYCLQMAPGIAALSREGLLPLVVSTGEAEENRQMARDHHL